MGILRLNPKLNVDEKVKNLQHAIREMNRIKTQFESMDATKINHQYFKEFNTAQYPLLKKEFEKTAIDIFRKVIQEYINKDPADFTTTLKNHIEPCLAVDKMAQVLEEEADKISSSADFSNSMEKIIFAVNLLKKAKGYYGLYPNRFKQQVLISENYH